MRVVGRDLKVGLMMPERRVARSEWDGGGGRLWSWSRRERHHHRS